MYRIDKDDNIKLIKGDTMRMYLAVDNYQLSEGDKLYFTVKEDFGYTENAIQIVITEFSSGVAFIEITAEMSNSLPVGLYFYDVQIELKDGTVDTIKGPRMFKILREITSANKTTE